MALGHCGVGTAEQARAPDNQGSALLTEAGQINEDCSNVLKKIEGMVATFMELEAVRYPIAEAAAADAARCASTSSSGSQYLGNGRAEGQT